MTRGSPPRWPTTHVGLPGPTTAPRPPDGSSRSPGSACRSNETRSSPMSVDGPRVTFCVIGAGKAGTTWMYEVLAAHSQVTVARAKETMYFDDNFHRGIGWYHSMFPDGAATDIVGEVSNSYLAAPTAPERI